MIAETTHNTYLWVQYFTTIVIVNLFVVVRNWETKYVKC